MQLWARLISLCIFVMPFETFWGKKIDEYENDKHNVSNQQM